MGVIEHQLAIIFGKILQAFSINIAGHATEIFENSEKIKTYTTIFVYICAVFLMAFGIILAIRRMRNKKQLNDIDEDE